MIIDPKKGVYQSINRKSCILILPLFIDKPPNHDKTQNKRSQVFKNRGIKFSSCSNTEKQQKKENSSHE
jgi:hypothetical protein